MERLSTLHRKAGLQEISVIQQLRVAYDIKKNTQKVYIPNRIYTYWIRKSWKQIKRNIQQIV